MSVCMLSMEDRTGVMAGPGHQAHSTARTVSALKG